jgi:TctA family transporter
MTVLEPDQRYWLALATLGVSCFVILIFIVRSTIRNKPILADSQKMYAIFLASGIIGALGFSGVVGTDVISALVGVIAGLVGGGGWRSSGESNK